MRLESNRENGLVINSKLIVDSCKLKGNGKKRGGNEMSKYITDKYEGSISYTSVVNATEEKLLCRKHYVEIAVDYHVQEGDQGQINFFKSELKHIEKRLNLLQKEKR